MQKSFPLILIFFLCLASCVKEASYNYTPEIAVSPIMRGSDTVKVGLDSEGHYVLDSLAVNDTIQFDVIFDAIGNNLLTAQVVSDSNVLKIDCGNISALVPYLNSSSDTLAGKFCFDEGYRMVGLSLEAVARKSGTHTIQFRAVSDSEYSPAEMKLYCPVK